MRAQVTDTRVDIVNERFILRNKESRTMSEFPVYNTVALRQRSASMAAAFYSERLGGDGNDGTDDTSDTDAAATALLSIMSPRVSDGLTLPSHSPTSLGDVFELAVRAHEQLSVKKSDNTNSVVEPGTMSSLSAFQVPPLSQESVLEPKRMRAFSDLTGVNMDRHFEPDRSGATKFVGVYSPRSRRKRIDRFIAKRKARVWQKKVEYSVRKDFADSRLRVKGRFVRKEDEDQLRMVMELC